MVSDRTIFGIVLDAETGGFTEGVALTSLSARLCRWSVGKEAWTYKLPYFNMDVEPAPGTVVSVDALRIQGLSWEDLGCGVPEPSAVFQLLEWWADAVDFVRQQPGWDSRPIPIIAHNAPFDRSRITEMIGRYLSVSRIHDGDVDVSMRVSALAHEFKRLHCGRHAVWVCTMQLAHALVADGRLEFPPVPMVPDKKEPSPSSLEGLARVLGVKGRDKSEVHVAGEDVRICAEVYTKLLHLSGALKGDGNENE